jgi:mycothiol synthase
LGRVEIRQVGPVQIAAYSPAHRPAVVALAGAALDVPEDAGYAAAMVDRLLDPPPGRRTVRLVALDRAATLAGVLFASGREDDGAVGHLDLIAVAPAARRRGVARALVVAGEGELAALGVRTIRISGNDPCYAWPGIDVRYTPALCTALALGYRQVRTAWNMMVDLARLGTPGPGEAALADRGVHVRRAQAGDLPALQAFADEHFGGGWGWEAGQAVLRPAAGCYLACRGDRLLGFAAFGTLRPDVFGPMGTAPAARGMGVGAALLRRCLLDQRAAGLTTAQIGWAGPVAFYCDTVAARIERVFVLCEKQLSA